MLILVNEVDLMLKPSLSLSKVLPGVAELSEKQ
jgi:hypothetical protein